MNGGKMYQDCTSHTRSHPLFVKDSAIFGQDHFLVTSTHHQMMMPSKDGEVLATGITSYVKYWNDSDEMWMGKDIEHGVEVVKYDLALCFQPHPEFGMVDPVYTQMRNYFFYCIKELMAD